MGSRNTEHMVSTPVVPSTSVTSPTDLLVTLKVINTVDHSLIGKYCIIRYDNGAYPGKIEDLDDTDVQVRCMHKAGQNRFYWCTTVPYICWYSYKDVLSLIDEPSKVGSRHVQVDPAMWDLIMQHV